MASHHYFRDFYFCDSGMIPWLLVLELLSKNDKPLSQLVGKMMTDYPVSGEINTKVSSTDKVQEIMARVEKIYGAGRQVSHIDGVSIDFDDWRFNLRGSQTEPYIRLNVESRGDKNLMETKRDELLSVIRS